MKKIFQFITSVLLLTQVLYSCGLRYTPPESPEEYQVRRRKAIENYTKANLGEDSSSFNSIAFGQTQIIKPQSFLILDSLYNLKYSQNRSDKELEEQIKIQKEIAENEKDKIKYLEFFVFNFGKKDSLQVVETEVLVDKSFSVVDQSIVSVAAIPEKHLEMYKRYLFNESFLYPETYATYAEERFYNLFKEKANTLVSKEKDDFLVHTLEIMDLAKRLSSIQTATLLNSLGRSIITLEDRNLQIEKINDIYLEEDGTYWFTIDCSMGTGKKVQYYFSFDQYLELLKKERIE